MADPISTPNREPQGLTREERRERFRLNRVQALTSLLEQRTDLRGVSRVADHLDDAVRWTV